MYGADDDLFIIFSVLRFASAIASEDPGPSTEGAGLEFLLNSPTRFRA